MRLNMILASMMINDDVGVVDGSIVADGGLVVGIEGGAVSGSKMR